MYLSVMKFVRGSLVVALSWLTACATLLACSLAARSSARSVWLMQTSWALAVSLVCAVGVAWAGYRWIPYVRSKWWLVLAATASVSGPIAALIVSAQVELAYGTPAYGCHWAGMRVNRCIGRDWSFLQDRLEHLTMEGEMDVKVCQAFVGGILPEPRNSRGPDGWINCPADDPSVWKSADCRDVALGGMANCFACGGLSDTSDFYRHSVGFSAGCERGKVRFGINVPLCLIDECSRSNTVEHCRSVTR